MRWVLLGSGSSNSVKVPLTVPLSNSADTPQIYPAAAEQGWAPTAPPQPGGLCSARFRLREAQPLAPRLHLELVLNSGSQRFRRGPEHTRSLKQLLTAAQRLSGEHNVSLQQ